MEHDEFFRRVQNVFEATAPDPSQLPQQETRTGFFTKFRVFVAAGILAAILFLVWIARPPEIPNIPNLSPLFSVRSWIVLKAPVEGHSTPGGAASDHWPTGTRLYVYSYTVTKTPNGALVPDHRWAVVKNNLEAQMPEYASFDEIAPSLPPDLAYGAVGQNPQNLPPANSAKIQQ